VSHNQNNPKSRWKLQRCWFLRSPGTVFSIAFLQLCDSRQRSGSKLADTQTTFHQKLLAWRLP